MQHEVNIIKSIEVTKEDGLKSYIRLMEFDGGYLVTMKKEYSVLSPSFYSRYYEDIERANDVITFFLGLAES